MPHIHVLIREDVVDALGVRHGSGVEHYVAETVTDAFKKHAGEELDRSQVIWYPKRVTHSMPVDMNVNVTVWYNEARAPHLEAIEREILAQLRSRSPRLKVEVHLIPVGYPKQEDISRSSRLQRTHKGYMRYSQ